MTYLIRISIFNNYVNIYLFNHFLGSLTTMKQISFFPSWFGFTGVASWTGLEVRTGQNISWTRALSSSP